MTDWDGLARVAITEMLERELAVTAREIEARAANEPWPSIGQSVDPDILTGIRNELSNDGVLDSVTARTRGAPQPIQTWHLAGARRQNTQIARAAARKRLLTARHASWARPTARHPKGLIGRAGEEALWNQVTATDGFSHLVRDVEHLADRTIDGGSVDIAGYLVAEQPEGPQVLTVLMEMKNQRQWFYAADADLHRFLYKAADYQARAPDALVLPVFVSSRRANEALDLAQVLGFYMVRYQAQYVLDHSDVDTRLFREVYEELGYRDLVRGTTPNVGIRRGIGESLVKNALAVAKRWRLVAPLNVDIHRQLRDAAPELRTTDLVNRLRENARAVAGPPERFDPLPRRRV